MLTRVILTEVEGEPQPTRFAVYPPGRLVLGRSAGCSIKVSDLSASRRHCLIVAGDGGVWVQDLGSRNGTYVNGELVGRRRSPDDLDPTDCERPLRELHDGDEVRLGRHVFRIALEEAAAEGEAAGELMLAGGI